MEEGRNGAEKGTGGGGEAANGGDDGGGDFLIRTGEKDARLRAHGPVCIPGGPGRGKFMA